MTREERYRKILGYFERNRKPSETELEYTDPFSLLVAVILSAQCTDKRVNTVTPNLLSRWPDARSMASATPDEVFPYIRSISYPNSKSRYLVGMAQALTERFGGLIPSEISELVTLPGVGRKTANVIASVVYDKPAMAVDTHVFRVSARLGLTRGARNPLQCEKQLTTFIPERLLPKAHHWLILHGRYVCTARSPRCAACDLTPYCLYFEKNNSFVDTTETKQLNKITHGKKESKKSGKEIRKESFPKRRG